MIAMTGFLWVILYSYWLYEQAKTAELIQRMDISYDILDEATNNLIISTRRLDKAITEYKEKHEIK